MSSQRRPPRQWLRDVVECYWVAERDLSAEGGFLVTPDRFVDLLFTGDVIDAEAGGRREPLPRCTLLGLLSHPVRLTSVGTVRCAGVRMQGWVKGLCFPRWPDRQWCDAAAAVAGASPTIFSALREKRDEDLFDLFEGLIDGWMSPILGHLGAYAELFTGGGGGLSLSALCGRFGRSPRQTERRVKALTHMSPKQLACIVRFQSARDRLWSEPGGSLSRIALESGYADQSHMTRDFRRFAGMTPKAFARRMSRARSGNS